MAKLRWNKLSHPTDKRKEVGKDEVTFGKPDAGGSAGEFPIKEATPVPANRLDHSKEYPIKKEDKGARRRALVPAYHQRCPWFAQLPVADLKEGESFDIPFSKFASDSRVKDKHHTSSIIELMRSTLRQFFEKEFASVNNRLGTRVDKKHKVVTVFRRMDVDVKFLSGRRAVPVKSNDEDVTRVRTYRSPHCSTAKELVEGAGATAISDKHHSYTDRRVTITDENVAKVIKLMDDSDTTVTAVVNEIVAAFFDHTDLI
jgi:hypothetical protein